MASQWKDLADSLAASKEHKDSIAISRLDCEKEESLCERLRVERTPTLKAS